MARGWTIALAVLACMSAVAVADVCIGGTTLSKNGATFDVAALQRTGNTPDFEVTDGDIPCTATVEKNYTYVFDVCADVTGDNKPAVCASQTGAALQMWKNADGTDGGCAVAGRHGSLELINPNNPALGIQLTYLSGDPCTHPVNTPYRQVTLVFGCADNPYPTPTVANEPSHCEYMIEMPSVYGCPLECPLGGEQRSLCSGHGICGYDKTNAAAKCFCDTGFGGADCNTAVDADGSSGGNGAIIGLLVTVLLIALVLGVVLFFVIRMLRAYRQDAHNYMAMHNQDLGTHDI